MGRPSPYTAEEIQASLLSLVQDGRPWSSSNRHRSTTVLEAEMVENVQKIKFLLQTQTMFKHGKKYCIQLQLNTEDVKTNQTVRGLVVFQSKSIYTCVQCSSLNPQIHPFSCPFWDEQKRREWPHLGNYLQPFLSQVSSQLDMPKTPDLVHQSLDMQEISYSGAQTMSAGSSITATSYDHDVMLSRYSQLVAIFWLVISNCKLPHSKWEKSFDDNKTIDLNSILSVMGGLINHNDLIRAHLTISVLWFRFQVLVMNVWAWGSTIESSRT